jgi:hypothetical protein
MEPVRILSELSLKRPSVLVVVDLAVAEQREEPIHFLVVDGRRRPTLSTLATGTSTVVSLATIRRWKKPQVVPRMVFSSMRLDTEPMIRR